MILVIGDIHGMFDPLKRIMSQIQAYYNNESSDKNNESSDKKGSDKKIEKIIFLGDYIDYGPSSKEVVDYIIGLPFEKVCLMGNHDDLMLQFLKGSDLLERFGNVWFRGNGGQRTVTSFFPKVYYRDHEEDIKREEFPLSGHYLDFFNNLKLTHEEQIGKWKLAFVHAMFSSNFPLQEQLAIKTYDDFHAWRKEKKVWIEDTILWDRTEPTKKFDDYIIFHGHTPTINLHRAWKNLHEYDVKSEIPFLKFEESEKKEKVKFYDRPFSSKRYSGDMDQLISVNVDTGAVYGGRLTAIAFSEDMLNEGEFMVYQVSVSKGYRLSEEFSQYKIKVSS